MDDNSHKQSDQFDAALPLPIDDVQKISKKRADEKESEESSAAADIIRKRVEAAYTHEPSANTEVHDLSELGDDIPHSKHQEFIYQLTSSGKPLHEIQVAWHEYYAALSDEEKNEVWREFYSTHAQAAHYPAETGPTPVKDSHPTDEEIAIKQLSRPVTATIGRALYGINHRPKKTAANRPKTSPKSLLHSLAFGLSVGGLIILILMFSFFNERFIAPFIQPSRNVSGTPIISAAGVISPNPEVIIPKINVEIPVVYDVATTDDTAVENALEGGVVHYADTAMPGQDGNVVIVGHSSNNIFNPGKYKFAFVLLSRLDSGDTFYLDKDGKRYTYQVYRKQIVSPTDVSVLGPADRTATATLITCDPPGTSTNRLVVTAEQIDPSSAANTAQTTTNKLATQAAIIPGNSPTLWSRLVKWLSY